MRRVLLLVAAVAMTAVVPARAAEWGTIIPGTSTMESVRAQYGGPTRTENQKVDNYDTTSWVYEAAQAPTGMTRMVVDFGILQSSGFRREVVRSFRLEPKPGVFTRQTILTGWGMPKGFRQEGGTDAFFYEEGLIVVFEKDAWSAASLVFTPPQPASPAPPPR